MKIPAPSHTSDGECYRPTHVVERRLGAQHTYDLLVLYQDVLHAILVGARDPIDLARAALHGKLPEPVEPAPPRAPAPSLGRIVHYRLTAEDAEHINKKRQDAEFHLDAHNIDATGTQLHRGTVSEEGDLVPMMITYVYDDQDVRGQAFLDGTDSLWVFGTRLGIVPGTYSWPPRV